MIASLVATLENTGDRLDETVTAIRSLPDVEVGEVPHGTRRVPLTIDSTNPNALEETTRRLQQCDGVAFVDVVFVHLEDDTDQSLAS